MVTTRKRGTWRNTLEVSWIRNWGIRMSSKGYSKGHENIKGLQGMESDWNYGYTAFIKGSQQGSWNHGSRQALEHQIEQVNSMLSLLYRVQSARRRKHTKSTQTELRSKNRSKLKTKEKIQEATSPREVQEVSTIKTSPLLHHCRLPLSRTLGKDGEVFARDGRGSPPDQSNTYGRQTGLRGYFARMLCGKTPMKGFECLISIVITT